jgi:hypothetical protein
LDVFGDERLNGDRAACATDHGQRELAIFERQSSAGALPAW